MFSRAVSWSEAAGLLDLQRVVGDGRFPAVGAGNRLVELSVEIADVRLGAVVYLVVEVG